MTNRIVLVSGAPGAGKTTLARPLATALGFALISKDDIKEPLFDALGGVTGDLEMSRRIGAASWEVLWALAAHSPRAVLEANFHPGSAHERDRLLGLGGQIVEVFCRCPPDEVARRYAERAVSSARHRAHAAVPSLSAQEIAEHFGTPLALGPVFEVDTTQPVDIVALAQKIAGVWG